MKLNLNIKIGQSLAWLAIGISLLLAVLLVEAVVLLNQVDESQRKERELSTALTAVLEARSASTEAGMLLNELALTGNLDSGVQANLLIDEARAAYRKAFPEDHQGVETVFALMDEMLAAGNRMAKVYMLEGREAGNRLKADPEQGLDGRREAILDRMGAEVRDFSRRLESNRQQVQEAGAQARWVLISSTSLLLVVIPLAFFLLYRKVNGSIRHIAGIVTVLGMGDFSARCRLKSGDELQLLADAFDRLLDERVEQMARSENENNQINDSIIRILEVTDKLSRHDLRVYAPVSEDITGAISDSINGAVADMADVLGEVRRIAEEVRGASSTVDQQANKVYSAAESNLATVVGTLHDLQRASESMEKVMSLAVMCHNVAGSATRSTGAGLESVTSSTEGMDRIRSSIQETSKRIKRLGDRSQEISGIVGIIKDIAERTHVLALNARIQASTAGEAGKGFSVVADEVKQLAESSRNATGQIANLIQNIQVETADTIATMEQAVAEVVSGTALSEQAKEQMLETRKTIARLAATVKQIAISTRSQVMLTREITSRADLLRESALNTQQEIEVQRRQSDRLSQSAARLTQSVGQFVLPETV